MSVAVPEPPPAPPGQPFNAEQREYLAGLMAGIAQRQLHPYVGLAAGGEQFTADPAAGGANLAVPAAAETIHGTPLADVNKQERWKHELHGLDAWDRLLAHAEQDKFPDEADQFRFRFHGLFYVAPAQNSFMLRCRIPAGELTAAQLRGLADLAADLGNGKAAITTRSNLQIREIAPRNLVVTLTRLAGLGLTARGSGVDNVRNITASPTAGLDPQELLDVRPYAHALHHYILNHRDLYDLPRKFNVAFEGGGSVDTVADTNDIGFMAVRVPRPLTATSVRDGAAVAVEPGVHFRVELCGITGHRQFASDAGLLVTPGQSVALSAAILRVFSDHGDRTDRKKARLKYLVDRWGVPKFLAEVQKRVAFPLLQVPAEHCERRPPAVRHGHIGVYRQRQPGKNYVGVVIPVGLMTARQMRRLADLADNYGSGQLRLTPWQNLLLPDIPDAYVETVKRQLVRIGFHHEATNVLGGLVACTGNQGCKWSSADTKGHAVQLGEYLNQRLRLDQPLNLHFTGCPNSCAQHYMGDIGFQAVKVTVGGQAVEGYNLVFGGGFGSDQAVAQQVFTGLPFGEIPPLIERVLRTYLAQRRPGEAFAAFTRRHSVKQLQELFAA
jgi:ferredoxin-nitrite reductase